MPEQGNQKEKPDISPFCHSYHLPLSRSHLQALSAPQTAHLEKKPRPLWGQGQTFDEYSFWVEWNLLEPEVYVNEKRPQDRG